MKLNSYEEHISSLEEIIQICKRKLELSSEISSDYLELWRKCLQDIREANESRNLRRDK